MITLIREDGASGITRFQYSLGSAKNHRAELALLLDKVSVWSEVNYLSFDLLVFELQVVEPSLSVLLCLFPTHKPTSQTENAAPAQDPLCAFCGLPGADKRAYGLPGLLCWDCWVEEIRVG